MRVSAIVVLILASVAAEAKFLRGSRVDTQIRKLEDGQDPGEVDDDDLFDDADVVAEEYYEQDNNYQN